MNENQKNMHLYENHTWESINPKNLVSDPEYPTGGRKAFVVQQTYNNLSEVLSKNGYDTKGMLDTLPIDHVYNNLNEYLSYLHAWRRNLKSLQNLLLDNAPHEEIHALLTRVDDIGNDVIIIMEHIDSNIDPTLMVDKAFDNVSHEFEILKKEINVLLATYTPHKNGGTLSDI